MPFKQSSLALRWSPWVFIVVWSCGYVVAKYAVPYAPPLSFLSLRFIGCIVLMWVLMRWAGKSLPRGAAFWHTALVGVLMQAGYLGGVWMAVAQGMPAGVSALVVNLQPVLTAVLGFWVGEKVLARQWAGLALGFVGVFLVLSTKINVANYGHMGWPAVMLAFGALFSMTLGTLYQKKFCPGIDPRSSQVVQFLASLVVTAPLALCLETKPIIWAPQLWAALLFSIFILSGVGITVLLWLIERGRATQVTGYMYWVPPLSSVMAWLMFNEQIAPLAWVGFVCVAVGVYAVVRPVKSKF